MCNLFTIGYATKDFTEFIRLLKQRGITCLVDVRTAPYSKQFPDYNRETLEYELKNYSISYLYFGFEFGARRAENEAYMREKIFSGEEIEYVNFKKVQNLDIFKQGCSRIINGINKGYKICFMCSEKLPYNCHRCVMVGDWFYQNGYEVEHIVDDGISVLHGEILNSDEMKELFRKCKTEYNTKYEYGGSSLIDSNGESAEFLSFWDEFFKDYDDRKIIRLLNLKIGYKKGDDNND